jgi:hypothetical protein
MATRSAIKVTGYNECLRALRGIPANATREIRTKSYEIARHVADDAGGGFVAPQAAPLIRGLKPKNDRIPTLGFGGSGRSGLSGGASLGDLIGANFGTVGRFKQFPPKRRPDYYIYATIQRDGHWIIETWTAAMNAVSEQFDRG